MSIIGESFEDYVQDQIYTRQILHGKKNRSNKDLSILSNQNAWIKMASSVEIVSGLTKEKLEKETSEKVTDKEFESYSKGWGEDKLKGIGLTNTDRFMGNELAKKAVLFNGLSEVVPTEKNDSGVTTRKGNYKQRSGVTNSNNEVWNDNFAYGLGGTAFGITPPPGIVSAKITCKNRGSIREANVEMVAQNKFQFELIEMLYLRLGYSMMLEWGWDKYQSATPGNENVLTSVENTIIEDNWFTWREKSFLTVLDSIEAYRAKYEGNYDGFLGKVVNFDWTFNPDGTYSITLKLITVGDVIESLTANLPQDIKSLADIQDEINEKYTTTVAKLGDDSSLVTGAIRSKLHYDLFTDIAQAPEKWEGEISISGSTTPTNYLGFYDKFDSDKSINDIVKSTVNDSDVNKTKFNYFLTLGELLNKIQRYVIPSINKEKILGIDISDQNICSIYPYQVSLDPKVALVQPAFGPSLTFADIGEYEIGSTGIKGYWDWMKAMKKFGTLNDNGAIYGNIMNIYLNYDFVSSTLNEVSKDGEIKLFKFLQKICEGMNSALGGLMKLEPILSKDRLITIIDQNPILGIENSSEFGDRFSPEPVQLELYGYNPSGSVQTSNFVRDFKFNTTIGPNIASMITIGATAEGVKTKNYDGTAFANWNKGLRDRYQISYDDPEDIPESKGKDVPNEASPLTGKQLIEIHNYFKAATVDEYVGIWPFKRGSVGRTYKNFGLEAKSKREFEDCPITKTWYAAIDWAEYSEICRQYVQRNNVVKVEDNQQFAGQYINWLIQAFGGKINGRDNSNFAYYYALNGDFITQGKQLFKQYAKVLNNKVYEKTGNPSNSAGFIPVGLSIDTDGLSGVKIYNSVSVRQEFLPPAYPGALKFVISKVNHDISENDWKTSLETISTANTKETSYGSIDLFANIVSSIQGELVEDVIYKGGEPKVSLTSGFDITNKRSRTGLIYVPEATNKSHIVIHHTAGGQSAQGDIGGWRKKSFPIATHYIIDRDAKPEHVFDDKFWSNHIGGNKSSDNKTSLSIEITSWGWLNKNANGTYRSYTGVSKSSEEWGGVSEVYHEDDEGNIVPNKNGYKGKKYFQSYTKAQLNSLYKIISTWTKDKKIPYGSGADGKFNYNNLFPKFVNSSITEYPGVYTHNSYRSDKIDVMPQKELLEMLKNEFLVKTIKTV